MRAHLCLQSQVRIRDEKIRQLECDITDATRTAADAKAEVFWWFSCYYYASAFYTVGLLNLVGNVNFTVIIMLAVKVFCWIMWNMYAVIMAKFLKHSVTLVCIREIYIYRYLLSLLFFQGRGMISKLQVDVCHYSQW